MRNMGHEDGTIPDDEVAARRLTALIYREYLDPQYLVPKPDKLIAADVNEPAFTRRVPGTVIYARPGDWLRIHVKNADNSPHSFHVHGVRYGIDSDGSWPFGTQSEDGRRSDEICPGQTWTYTFEVTEETIGVWPFHDHWQNIGTFPLDVPPPGRQSLYRRAAKASAPVRPNGEPNHRQSGPPIQPNLVATGSEHGRDGGAAPAPPAALRTARDDLGGQRTRCAADGRMDRPFHRSARLASAAEPDYGPG
jgi:hypothetical protein